MAENEQAFSLKQYALNEQMGTRVKENADFREILEDLEKKNKEEKGKLQ